MSILNMITVLSLVVLLLLLHCYMSKYYYGNIVQHIVLTR